MENEKPRKGEWNKPKLMNEQAVPNSVYLTTFAAHGWIGCLQQQAIGIWDYQEKQDDSAYLHTRKSIDILQSLVYF